MPRYLWGRRKYVNHLSLRWAGSARQTLPPLTSRNNQKGKGCLLVVSIDDYRTSRICSLIQYVIGCFQTFCVNFSWHMLFDDPLWNVSIWSVTPSRLTASMCHIYIELEYVLFFWELRMHQTCPISHLRAGKVELDLGRLSPWCTKISKYDGFSPLLQIFIFFDISWRFLQYILMLTLFYIEPKPCHQDQGYIYVF